MNFKKSIISRYRNFKIRHWSLFPEGKALKNFKGIHEGKRCFIIGNGPSLTHEDLDMIHNSGDISFAFNRIYQIFPQTSWRPTYYISQDEKMLAGCTQEVNDLGAQVKFLPIELDWYYNIHLKGIIPFHIVNSQTEEIDFSEDISSYVANSKTVVYTAIQFAFYMGFKEVYLIGVDHHFHISQNDKGEIIVDPNAKDYFSDSYNLDKKDLYIPNTDKSTLTFMAAKHFADLHDFRIFNATRGGKLEVFERRNFDSLFPHNKS